MKIVILLIPLAILLVGGAIAAFIWAVRRNQFDDLDSPAWRVIFDDRERREDDHD
jgi:cbb3-type cytochrome oxidase maturation protein